MISRRAGSGGGGLQRLLSAACLLISLPRGLAWPRKLISGACNTSHPLCWPEQRPTLAATCSPNTNTQALLWPWPCPAAPTQCTHFGTVHYWKPTASYAWAKRHTCAHVMNLFFFCVRGAVCSRSHMKASADCVAFMWEEAFWHVVTHVWVQKRQDDHRGCDMRHH